MVPFGYERKQLEKELAANVPESRYRRVYLNVTAFRRSSTGELIPQSFQWEGRTYTITKVLDSRNGQSFKEKINAWRFYCTCRGKKFQLFFEDGGFGNQRFYIEVKETYSHE